MIRPFLLRWLIPFALVLLMLPACGDSGDDPAETTLIAPTTTTTEAAATTTTTEAAATSTTVGPATATTPATTLPPRELIEVMFDGTECITDGPAQVAAGDYPFILTDLSGMQGAEVRTWIIDDGYTYDDVLNLQSEPGEYISTPDWAQFSSNSFAPVERDLAENQAGKTIVLDTGLHAILVGTGKPPMIWFCGALQVSDD
jgi:hypothetical protein